MRFAWFASFEEQDTLSPFLTSDEKTPPCSLSSLVLPQNWADTTRNALLFLFFGYFGGRSAFSRAFLLLSAPLCFLIQTRPVKVAMKQLFYTAGEPPGILLSLLPAPQQAIMSCDYAGIMVELYGEDVLEGEEWFELDRAEREGRAIGEGVDRDDDDDEEYSDSVYDSDEEF